MDDRSIGKAISSTRPGAQSRSPLEYTRPASIRDGELRHESERPRAQLGRSEHQRKHASYDRSPDESSQRIGRHHANEHAEGGLCSGAGCDQRASAPSRRYRVDSARRLRAPPERASIPDSRRPACPCSCPGRQRDCECEPHHLRGTRALFGRCVLVDGATGNASTTMGRGVGSSHSSPRPRPPAGRRARALRG
jgi:hypothetical protein